LETAEAVEWQCRSARVAVFVSLCVVMLAIFPANREIE
jgi:hypothetical protein